MKRRSFLGILAAIGAGLFGLNRGKVVGGLTKINPAVTQDSTEMTWRMTYGYSVDERTGETRLIHRRIHG